MFLDFRRKVLNRVCAVVEENSGAGLPPHRPARLPKAHLGEVKLARSLVRFKVVTSADRASIFEV